MLWFAILLYTFAPLSPPPSAVAPPADALAGTDCLEWMRPVADWLTAAPKSQVPAPVMSRFGANLAGSCPLTASETKSFHYARGTTRTVFSKLALLTISSSRATRRGGYFIPLTYIRKRLLAHN